LYGVAHVDVAVVVVADFVSDVIDDDLVLVVLESFLLLFALGLLVIKVLATLAVVTVVVVVVVVVVT
jgi:hypothetical protein